MLGANDKLVGVTRVFEIVDKTRGDGGQLIVLLQVLFNVTNLKQIVKTLERVNNVNLIVERIFFEVALRNLSYERAQ
jgi:hypothetical protein